MWICGRIATYVRGHTLQSQNPEAGGVINFFNRVFRVPTGEVRMLPDNHENAPRVNR
ncbi:MAG: hypothetical protein ACJAYU_002285 [Bradymonadia bacterium]|jgi:hypothetical protein